jgi:hypothetical protein
MTRIVVKNQYTYETDLPVKVGDIVLLPTAAWMRSITGDTWSAKVTALTSDYKGPCQRVIKIVD